MAKEQETVSSPARTISHGGNGGGPPPKSKCSKFTWRLGGRWGGGRGLRSELLRSHIQDEGNFLNLALLSLIPFMKHRALPTSIKMKTFLCRDLICGLRAWPLRKPRLPPPFQSSPGSFVSCRQACIPLNAPGIAYSHRNPLPQAFPARSKPAFHGQSGSGLEQSREVGGTCMPRWVSADSRLAEASPVPDPGHRAPWGGTQAGGGGAVTGGTDIFTLGRKKQSKSHRVGLSQISRITTQSPPYLWPRVLLRLTTRHLLGSHWHSLGVEGKHTRGGGPQHGTRP